MGETGKKYAKRRLVFLSFDQVYRELDELEASGYVKLGKWTLGEVCEHLRLAVEGSLRGSGDVKVPAVFRLGAWGAFRMMMLTNWMPSGVKAPEAFLPRVGEGEERELVEGYRRVLGEFEHFEGELHPSPLFGELTREQWGRLHLLHAAHHLGFLVPRG